MKNYTKILTLTALLIAVCLPAYAGNIWNAADSSAPFVLRYTDAAKVGTVTATSTTLVLTDDSNANTLTFADDAYDVDDVIAFVNSSTNASGDKNFEAVPWASISSDLVTNDFIVALSATPVTSEWNYDVKWDTSNCLHYDSAVGVMVGSTPVQAGQIDRIFGDPTGTGDVTLHIYVDGQIEWQRTIASPVFVPTVSGDTNLADNASAFDFAVGIDVGTQPAFLRAARATTATTGGIGVSDGQR